MKASESLSRAVAVTLSAALLLTAPGADCYRVMAGETFVAVPAAAAGEGWAGAVNRLIDAGPQNLSVNTLDPIALPLLTQLRNPDLPAALRTEAMAPVMARLESQAMPAEPAAQIALISQALVSAAPEIQRLPAAAAAPTQERSSNVSGSVEQAARQWAQNADFEAPAAVHAAETVEGPKAVASAPQRRGAQITPPAPSMGNGVLTQPSIEAASFAVSTVKALPSIVLTAAPVAAIAFGGISALGVGPAAAVALAGFAVGAVAARGLIKHVISRTKMQGPAAAGAWVLGLAAGGAIAGGATLLLASLSPFAAAGAVSVSALARRLLSRPSPSPIQRAPAGPESPLFTVAKVNGKYLLAIDKSQFGKPYLLSATLEKGTGEKFLYSGFPSGQFLWYFERVGDSVQIVAKNTLFRAQAGTAQDRAVSASAPDSSIVKAKVLSDDPATGLTVVEMDSFFASDILRMNATLDQAYKAHYGLDKDLSAVESVKAFPKNVEVLSRLTFARGAGQAPATDSLVPDAQNLSLTLRYSLSELPQGQYTPRRADDRVGHFTTVFQDWTDPQAEELTVRFINRWKLEKADPSAELSPVKEPIVFWLDATIPDKYRDTARQAVLKWNKAFEKAGFKDAIVVKDAPKPGETAPAPEKASRFADVRGAKTVAAWVAKTPLMRIPSVKAEVEALLAPKAAEAYYDPSDARFNAIRWYVPADGGGPAFGPSRANPITGQIYNASVSFPYLMAHGSGEMDLADASRADGKAKAAHGHSHDDDNDPAHCKRAIQAAQEAKQALEMAESRGPMTAADKDRFVQDYITNVILHEVGHTLGLRHNFRASGWKSDEELGATHDGVVSASVMDYGAANVAAPGKPQGSYWQTDLGPYDYWAIEYAYTPLDGMSAEAEANALGKIASRSGEPGLEYGTDEDLTGMDPLVQHWYIGKDLLSFAKNRMDTVRQMWSDIQKQDPAAGKGYQELYTKYRRGFIIYQMAADIASRYIGGIYYHRNHVGDAGGKLPYEPVSAEQQRQTLAFLNEYVFTDKPFSVDPVFLRKLAPQRQATVENANPVLGYMPYDRYVLMVRRTALAQMFDPAMLMRLHESRQMAEKDEDAFTIQELFVTLTQDIWTETLAKKAKPAEGTVYAISPLRRALQQDYLQQLILAAYAGRSNPEAAAAGQQNLMALAQILQKELKQGGWDSETMAHLQQALMSIKQGLEMGPLLARRQAADED